MNKLLHRFESGIGVLKTPCYPASYYAGPVTLGIDGEWHTTDNRTSRWYYTRRGAFDAAQKEHGRHKEIETA